jgi:hypothetical protein
MFQSMSLIALLGVFLSAAAAIWAASVKLCNTTDLTKALLVGAELDDLVEEIVSVNEVKLARPRAEVYLHGARRRALSRKSWRWWLHTHGTSMALSKPAWLQPILPQTALFASHAPARYGGPNLPELARRLAAL